MPEASLQGGTCGVPLKARPGSCTARQAIPAFPPSMEVRKCGRPWERDTADLPVHARHFRKILLFLRSPSVACDAFFIRFERLLAGGLEIEDRLGVVAAESDPRLA